MVLRPMSLPSFELDFLLSQDKLTFAAERPATGARAELSPAECQRLVFLVRNELQSQGYLIAAVGSLANMLAAGIEADAGVLLAYLPPEAHSTIALLDKLIGADLPPAVLGDLQEVVSRLESARTMTKAFCREHTTEAVRGGVHVDVLAGAWRDLGECAATLLGMLSGHTSGSAQTEHASRVIALLTEVANGHSPCVRPDGSVEIPGWAERRREQRWVVDWPVRVSAPGGFAPARILNLSRNGLCLSTEVLLRHLETVSIEASPGRRLPGQVMWSKGNRHGVRLFMSLAASDPLIVAARTGLSLGDAG